MPAPISLLKFTEFPIGAPIAGEVWINPEFVCAVSARVTLEADPRAYTVIELSDNGRISNTAVANALMGL